MVAQQALVRQVASALGADKKTRRSPVPAILARHGDDFYSRLGRMGGSAPRRSYSRTGHTLAELRQFAATQPPSVQTGKHDAFIAAWHARRVAFECARAGLTP